MTTLLICNPSFIVTYILKFKCGHISRNPLTLSTLESKREVLSWSFSSLTSPPASSLFTQSEFTGLCTSLNSTYASTSVPLLLLSPLLEMPFPRYQCESVPHFLLDSSQGEAFIFISLAVLVTEVNSMRDLFCSPPFSLILNSASNKNFIHSYNCIHKTCVHWLSQALLTCDCQIKIIHI